MPCRRPHRKSRLGCRNCKAKRTKCDEIHPVCSQCKKYDLQCAFSTPLRSKVSSLPPVKITSLTSPRNRASPLLETSSNSTERLEPEHNSLWAVTMNTPQDRLLELKLMHHFTTTVSATMFRLIGNYSFQQAMTCDVFSRWVVDLAMRDSGLMDALLGFSAFNLRKLQGHDDKDLQIASHSYMTGAIEAHTGQLRQGINEQNAEILFAGSALLALVAVSSHEYISLDDDTSLPLHWFRPWQGVRSIVKASIYHLQSEDILALLDNERQAYNTDFVLLKSKANRFDFLLEGLDRSTIDAETLEAYETSVYWLSLIEENPHQDYCFKFTAKAPPKFVHMLVEKDPRALTIVGYFYLVLKDSERLWWLPRSTGREFSSLMKLLPDEWKPRMAWAVGAFEGCDQ